MDVELSGNDYRGATLPKSYLTVREIIMQCLKLISKLMSKLIKRSNRYGRTDPNHRKASLLTSSQLVSKSLKCIFKSRIFFV